MRIGFIGAGRVGYTLGKYLKTKGFDISGYFSRNQEHAADAAQFTDTRYFSSIVDLIKESDAVFITVSDNAIGQVFDNIKHFPETNGKIFCHTSGALSSEIFEGSPYQVYGYSVHPMYAVSDKYTSYKSFSNAFITIEGSPEHLSEMVDIFSSSGLKTGTIDTSAKSKYHAASAVASNLVCGIYGFSKRLLTECGMDDEMAEKALCGLFRDNAVGITEKGVVAQLTGPLERNDISTVVKHLDVLNGDDKELYKKCSLEVLKIAKEKHEDTDYSKMEAVLKGKETAI